MDLTAFGPYALNVRTNIMLLLTESVVHTRKYLLWRHDVGTERSEVRAAWRHNNIFRMDQTQG